jgi:hypothetical protein
VDHMTDTGSRTSIPTVGLAMIVKNETKVLPRLAANLLPHIDGWVIVDTGSDDGTPEMVTDLFGSKPGELLHAEWDGFAPARNLALDAAAKRWDWVLHMDADETLAIVGSDQRFQRLGHWLQTISPDVQGVDAEVRYGDLRYNVPRVLRSSAGWRWHGRAHEYLGDRDGAGMELCSAPLMTVEHHADGGNRAAKFARGIEGLTRDWAENVNPPRTAFYLGRTHDDYGEAHDAIHWYSVSLRLDGWDEERFYATWRLGELLLRTGPQTSSQEGLRTLWEAHEMRPWRLEPLWSLARYHRERGEWWAAWEAVQAPHGVEPRPVPDRLFVHSDVKAWKLPLEAVLVAPHIGSQAVALQRDHYQALRSTASLKVVQQLLNSVSEVYERET